MDDLKYLRGAVDGSSNGFGDALRSWRRHRGYSQLELSVEAGISSRHLSFLETGRARPSCEMVYLLLGTLDVPLRERNRILLAAGFAPGYTESTLDGDEMGQVRRAVRLLLDRHQPYPAYAMDGAWNVLEANAPFWRLTEAVLPLPRGAPLNILRLFFSPELLRPHVVDWESSAREVLRRVGRQLAAPVPPRQLAEIVEEIRGYPGVADLAEGLVDPSRFGIFVPVAIRMGDRTARWMTTIVTFGGALDVTLDDLVVECFFPADPATEELIQNLS